jgi:hypothetical protein
MDRHDIAEQVRVEQELLRHVMEGLRLSTTWQVQGPDAHCFPGHVTVAFRPDWRCAFRRR